MNRLRLGYVPLLDAAPLIVAHEMGFAAEERLDLDLIRLGAWAQCRDMLGASRIDAAHMLMPMPIAQALGLGPDLPAMDLLMFLSQGGQIIGISRDIADRLTRNGYRYDFRDAAGAGDAIRKVCGEGLRIGVPFHFSTHAELIRIWLSGCGFDDAAIQLVTIPPPLMADAIGLGDIDMFCVGEPWASVAVERGVAQLILPGTSVWASPPEKGLVMRREFAEMRPAQTGQLMRALWRAGQWLDHPDHRGVAAEILSRPEYLDVPPDLAERGLRGRVQISPEGDVRDAPGFVTFHERGANFPWKSCAALMARRIASRHGLDVNRAMQSAMRHFRTDLYRGHLRSAGAALPGASLRVEGALAIDRTVPAEKGEMILRADGFFDGSTFDPPVPVED